VANRLNRRETIRVTASAGAFLTLGGFDAISQYSRSMSMMSAVQDAATVTPKVVKVTFENERVRVLDYLSEPGDKEGLHSHPAFVVYVVSGGTLRIQTSDGKSNDVEFNTGDVRWRDPVTHSTENIGRTPLHAIIVELKTP